MLRKTGIVFSGLAAATVLLSAAAWANAVDDAMPASTRSTTATSTRR